MDKKYTAIVDFGKGGHHLSFLIKFIKHLINLNHRIIVISPFEKQILYNALKEKAIGDDTLIIKQAQFSRPSIKVHKTMNSSLNTFFLWVQLTRYFFDCQKKHKIKINRVFFAWLDSLIDNYVPYQLVDIIFPYKWSGLYFHPWYLYNVKPNEKCTISSKDYMLKSKNCCGIGIHMDNLKHKLMTRVNKEIQVFPEFADLTQPEKYWLVDKLLALAGNRFIVFLIGLNRYKGVLSFIETVINADTRKFYFFMAGKINHEKFSKKELNYINAFINNLPENCYYYPEHIPEGAYINSIIQNSHIVYAVYENFKSSSNFITKAAWFNIPVLASENYWIGATTNQFNLGVTVQENNLRNRMNGLEELANHYNYYKLSMNKASYFKIHDEANVKTCLKTLIS